RKRPQGFFITGQLSATRLCGVAGAQWTKDSSMHIQIYDTTLRDGSQGEGVNFSLQDKLLIAARLDELGFDFIEGGYPLSNEKDAQFFQRVQELNLKHARVCAFGMTRRKGVRPDQDPGMKALLDSGAKTLTIVGK